MTGDRLVPNTLCVLQLYKLAAKAQLSIFDVAAGQPVIFAFTEEA